MGKFRTFLQESSGNITNIEVGMKIPTADGNELTIKEIWIAHFHTKWPVTMILYKYKTADGTTGTETNSLETVKKMIMGEK